MSAARKVTVLVSKDGKRKWASTDPVETTNLRAQGWQDKDKYDKAQAKKAATQANKQAAAPALTKTKTAE